MIQIIQPPLFTIPILTTIVIYIYIAHLGKRFANNVCCNVPGATPPHRSLQKLGWSNGSRAGLPWNSHCARDITPLIYSTNIHTLWWRLVLVRVAICEAASHQLHLHKSQLEGNAPTALHHRETKRERPERDYRPDQDTRPFTSEHS